MTRTGSRRGLRTILATMVGALVPLSPLAAQPPPPTPVPPGTPVTITVTPATPPAPPASFTLHGRHGHVIPVRSGCTHTGGGNIDVAQPSPDTVVVTMTGVAVAYGACKEASAVLEFDLEQCLEVNFDNPKLKRVKLTMEGRVIGLLRSGCKGGSAAYDKACGVFGTEDGSPLLSLCVPPHEVAAGENLSVNDHAGPVSVPITSAGKYTYRQSFLVSAVAPKGWLLKGPSAEFAPDPALDPLWISYKEPFHGAVKKEFGFQVTFKIAEETQPGNGAEKGPQKLPEPKPEEKRPATP
jgi:hypothetical protein